jgi:hypothetical protein
MGATLRRARLILGARFKRKLKTTSGDTMFFFAVKERQCSQFECPSERRMRFYVLSSIEGPGVIRVS